MKVEPIRDRKLVTKITQMLSLDRSRRGKRRYLLWLCGIYLGRRVGDLLQLKVGDVRGKYCVVCREQKTGKRAEMWISGELRNAFNVCLMGRHDDEYIFSISGDAPINERTAYRDIQEIKKLAGIRDINMGTHTLRKTFGYHYYHTTHDIAGLMSLFNHSSQATTMIYIGIDADETREAYEQVSRMYGGRYG